MNIPRYLVLFFTLLIASQLFIQLPAWAFKPDIHGEITADALSAITITSGNQTLTFSQPAIQQIVEENKRTDAPAYQTQSDLHFDNEDFSGGSRRLITLKTRVISKIVSEPSNGPSARADLGGALHTVQDFYAHSNWVDIGRKDINSQLGREQFSGAGKSIATCPTDPGILSGSGLSQLTSGYFLFQKGLCGVPTGKCRHGVDLLSCPSGLNKDEPTRKGFNEARSLAVEASRDFVNQITSDLRVVDNANAIKSLMGIN